MAPCAPTAYAQPRTNILIDTNDIKLVRKLQACTLWRSARTARRLVKSRQRQGLPGLQTAPGTQMNPGRD